MEGQVVALRVVMKLRDHQTFCNPEEERYAELGTSCLPRALSSARSMKQGNNPAKRVVKKEKKKRMEKEEAY